MAPLRSTYATSYDLTTGVIVDMDEAIYLVSPVDSPFLTGVDSDGLSILSSQPTNEKKVEWMHDAILTPSTTLAANAISTAVSLTVATGDALKFSIGDLVIVESEIIRIDSCPDSSTLTVTRGTPYGTTGAHTTGAQVVGVGQALPEGSDPPLPRFTDRSPFYNVTQIYGPEAVSLSKTEQIVAKYGVPNEMAHQLFQRTQELSIRREQAILYGQRIEDTNRRSMGGLFYYISTNSTGTAVLNVTSVAAMQQSCWSNGGMPDRLAANPIALTDLNALADTSRVRMDFADNRRGRVPIMVVITEFGELTVVRNRWLRTTDAALFKRDQVVRRPLRPLTLEPLAKTGDRDTMMMVCEESLEVKGQQHCAEFTALSYS